MREAVGGEGAATSRASPAAVCTSSLSEARTCMLAATGMRGSENPRLAGDGGSHSRAAGSYSSVGAPVPSGVPLPDGLTHTISGKAFFKTWRL